MRIAPYGDTFTLTYHIHRGYKKWKVSGIIVMNPKEKFSVLAKHNSYMKMS